MSTTETADYKFTVKEGQASKSGADDAPTSLMCEPRTRDLSIVGDKGFLSFKLRPDIRVEEAHEISKYLQDRIIGVSFTRFK
jgi:hypothetical protein